MSDGVSVIYRSSNWIARLDGSVATESNDARVAVFALNIL
jgi:hypothetical protein